MPRPWPSRGGPWAGAQGNLTGWLFHHSLLQIKAADCLKKLCDAENSAHHATVLTAAAAVHGAGAQGNLTGWLFQHAW